MIQIKQMLTSQCGLLGDKDQAVARVNQLAKMRIYQELVGSSTNQTHRKVAVFFFDLEDCFLPIGCCPIVAQAADKQALGTEIAGQ